LKDLPAGEGYVPRVDRLELKLIDVHFSYPGVDEPPVFKGLNYSCEQGRIIGIQGNSGQGRKTLMELLSGGLFPSSGTVFIPSHLRTLYVSRELVLLNLSLWQNLTFGNRRGNDPSRVEAILNHFEMKEVLERCKHDLDQRRKEIENQKTGLTEQEEEKEDEEEEEVGGGANALDKLREGTKAHIHLARAFIMNPEVLVMHRPFVNHHGKKNYNLLKDALQQHKSNRGFKMDESKSDCRRPRTIFFSADQQEVLEDNADIKWKLPKTVGGECTQGLVERVSRASSKQENVAGDDDVDSDEF
jgi:ABC-type nitrate/sulfonate/bicarbonate transport system ATPase subunit